MCFILDQLVFDCYKTNYINFTSQVNLNLLSHVFCETRFEYILVGSHQGESKISVGL